jgi:hypothetical protein
MTRPRPASRWRPRTDEASVADLTFLPALPRLIRRNVKSKATPESNSCCVPLVPTFVKARAAKGYKRRNRNTRLARGAERGICYPEARRVSCRSRDCLRVLRHRLIECSNQCMGTLGPGSGTVFRPHLRLSRGQVTRLNERPFDLCQGVVFVGRIEIIDEVTAHFRDRCAVGGYAELPMRKAFRNWQSPPLAQARKDREQAGAIGFRCAIAARLSLLPVT